MTHTQTIIAIILGAGVLGGLTNFYLSYDFNYKEREAKINFFKALLLSTSAAITVPLFLQIISNNLLDKPATETEYPVKNYFILAGFCVLAAFYSKRFLEDLYDRVKKIETKADNAEKKVEQLETNSQELDTPEEILTTRDTTKILIGETEYTEEQFKSVFSAIIGSKYTYRTVSGIVKDTKPPLMKEQVIGILNILKTNGLADSRKNKQGHTIWGLIIPND